MSVRLTLLHYVATAAPGAHVNCGESGGCDTGLPHVQAGDITTIIQYVFGVAGAVALIIIIIAALQFITASGDPQGVARARNTIIYAAVGLAACIIAEVLVAFVIKNV